MKENLFEMYARMCKSNSTCEKLCPIYKRLQEAKDCVAVALCQLCPINDPKTAAESVRKWAEEHPIKTRQEAFLELYPNAALDENGVLKISACYIDKRIICNTSRICEKCRKEYWGGEAE